MAKHEIDTNKIYNIIINALIHNQTFLDTIIHFQVEILSRLTNKPQIEIAEEFDNFIQKAYPKVEEAIMKTLKHPKLSELN